MANLTLTRNIPADITLKGGKVWKGEGDLRGEMITVLKGTLWITQTGDLNDYLICSGERFWVTKPGMVLVQATQDSIFHFSRDDQAKHEPVYAHLGAN